MLKMTMLASMALATGLAGAAQAQPESVTVRVGGDLADKVDELGARDVQEQVDRLEREVRDALARGGPLDGARIELVLTDLKPNRPTLEQASRRPGLSIIDSRSIGGATVEGQVTAADGRVSPVRLSRYSHNLSDVYGFTTWTDADRAFDLVARRLREGRLQN